MARYELIRQVQPSSRLMANSRLIVAPKETASVYDEREPLVYD